MTDIHELRANGGLKWGYYDEDVLPAWVAEMDFGLAPAITAALHDAVDRGLTAYPYPAALDATARAATDFWDDRFGWGVDPSWVYAAPDVVEGLARAIRHLTKPGSPVVLHTPIYFPFFGMVERAGRETIEVLSHRDDAGRYTLDLVGIDAALADGAGCVVLCNPWNPAGRVFSETELGDLLEVVTRHDARLLADEIHSSITYDGRSHVPVATMDPDRVVTVTSASKAWNLPGLKCAQVVLTNETDRQTWEDYFTLDKVGVGTLGLIANTAAYDSGREWFDEVLGRLESNRDLFAKLVPEHLQRAVCATPEGTYLAWLDMSAYEVDDPAAFLRDVARVAVSAGTPFGGEADRHIRFNFATEPSLIVEMVERMAAALDRR
ncbi:MAG: aminotransferase class I/II-fold pyridoxal phosphate-dependent enzyme [Acidimicrobiia bacterium]|jgi:cystathionine beta-lyase